MKKSVLMTTLIASLLLMSGCFGPGTTADEIEGMVFVEGDVFQMGDIFSGEEGAASVRVALNDYYIGEKEVSIAEYLQFLNDSDVDSAGYMDGYAVVNLDENEAGFAYQNGSFVFEAGEKVSSDLAAATGVSWVGACFYCNWKSEQDSLEAVYWIWQSSTGPMMTEYPENWGYRLPTEAEWEFAARNEGDHFIYSGTNLEDSLSNYAWYIDNTTGINICGLKSPNELGLYDMSGNAYEWCWDGYQALVNGGTSTYMDYSGSNRTVKILKGGDWNSEADHCTVYSRNWTNWDEADGYHTGFRLALDGSAPVVTEE